MEADEAKVARRAFRLIRQCEAYLDTQKAYRDKAIKNYAGEATEVAEITGRSKAVSNDVRAGLRKMMPSIMRTLLANDRIVEYTANKPENEWMAEQVTAYVNKIVIPACGAEAAIHDAVFDAALLKTGVLRWSAYEKAQVIVKDYTSVAPDEMLGLEDVGEIADVRRGEDGAMSFSLRVKQSTVDIRLDAVPRGSFLIHPSATKIEDSPLVGERQRVTRSDLVARGYDKDMVWSIASDDESDDDDDTERRGDDDDQVDADVGKDMEYVEIYDVFMRADLDGDGIAELHHLVLSEKAGENERDEYMTLEHKPAMEVPYSAVVIEREAHQFEGHAAAEDLISVQSTNTVLMRQILDNVTASNIPERGIQLDAVQNKEALKSRGIGVNIVLEPGRTLTEAIQYGVTPYVADKTLSIMEMMKREGRDRTGITDASAGVNPEALVGMSATQSGILNDAAVAQMDMVLRTLSRGGLRDAFKGLLRLVVAHADGAKAVRIGGQWVDMDPSQWDADLDCTVNIGLGAGSLDRDMMALQVIAAKQEQILQTLGPENPLVSPEQYHNTLAKMVEAMGLPSAEPFFTKPDPEKIAQKVAEKGQQPSPEQVKAQSAMQIEQMKTEMRVQVEKAQMEADMMVQQARIDAEAQMRAADNEAKRQIEQMKIAAQLQISQMKVANAHPFTNGGAM